MNDPDDVVIRRATAADIGSIVALLADDELGARRESPDDLAPYRRAFDVIDADPRELLVVAERGAREIDTERGAREIDTERGARVVGTLQLSLLPGLTRRGSLRAQIEGVHVAAGERGNALGARLVEWAVAEARDRGCRLVQLTSDKTRVGAHRFYERLGFVATHEGFKMPLP